MPGQRLSIAGAPEETMCYEGCNDTWEVLHVPAFHNLPSSLDSSILTLGRSLKVDSDATQDATIGEKSQCTQIRNSLDIQVFFRNLYPALQAASGGKYSSSYFILTTTL